MWQLAQTPLVQTHSMVPFTQVEFAVEHESPSRHCEPVSVPPAEVLAPLLLAPLLLAPLLLAPLLLAPLLLAPLLLAPVP
jgi:hypothetical protein